MKHHGSGRLVSVLASPTRTFQSIAERPTWLLPFLVLLGLGLLSVVVAVQKLDFDESIRYRLDQRGVELPPGEVEDVTTVPELAAVRRPESGGRHDSAAGVNPGWV